MNQITTLGSAEEWAVYLISSHHGKGANALFELIWKTGDCAWLPYHEASNLEVLSQYLESQGVSEISKLLWQISKNEDLPIVGISPANNIALHNLVTNVLSNASAYRAKNSIPDMRPDRLHRKAYNGEHSCWPHPFVPCNTMLNTQEYLERFAVFAHILT